MKRFTLWLTAGANEVLPAGDPCAHHLFMRALFHAKHDADLKFDVKTANLNRPSQQFKKSGLRRMPGIHTDDDETFDLEDDILEFLDEFAPSPCDQTEADDATCDLFKKFAWFLKNVDHDEKALNTEFLRMEKYLEENKTRFLCSDEITHIDCLVLTRLHSIRIAAKALKDYDIPSELQHVWQYLKSGYEEEMFRISCPSDQEIILHWTERKDTPKIDPKERARLVREEPQYTFSV